MRPGACYRASGTRWGGREGGGRSGGVGLWGGGRLVVGMRRGRGGGVMRGWVRDGGGRKRMRER